MRPDKQKVIDEVWDDARVESFLHKGLLGDETSADYSALLHAYRSMRPADFSRFLDRFVAEGRDVNARSVSGQTLLGTISGHRRAGPFRELLEGQNASV